MAKSHALSLDTTRDAREFQRSRWREASPARKAEMLEALCEDVRALSLAGARERHPHASAREQQLRVGALTISRELMMAAFGWDPVREGR